jgi:hypothetical protein
MVGFGRSEHGGQPLLSANELVTDGGNVMLPDASAKKTEIAFTITVFCKNNTQMLFQSYFGTNGGWHIERSGDAVIGWDLSEEVLDGVCADRGQHLGFEGIGAVGHPWVRVCISGHHALSQTSFLY